MILLARILVWLLLLAGWARAADVLVADAAGGAGDLSNGAAAVLLDSAS